MTLLTRKEAANFLKIGLSTLDKFINQRDFFGKIQIGRRILIDKDKLEDYIEKNIV